MKDFDLEYSKTALVLIEYQNEWVSDKGTLRNKVIQDKEQFEKAVELSKDTLALCRKKGYQIVHVTMKPDEDYKMFGDAKYGIRGAIPKAGTWQGIQGEIHPDFMPLNGEHVITERVGVSAFSGSNLDSFLRNNKIENLILIGFVTHVCVESTLRSAHDLGYNTFVLTEATGAFTDAQKDYFSTDIIRHFGKEICYDDL